MMNTALEIALELETLHLQPPYPRLNVWVNPGIAPEGYVDFCGGQYIFPCFYGDSKEIREYIAFLLYEGTNWIYGFTWSPDATIEDFKILLQRAIEDFKRHLIQVNAFEHVQR